MYKLVSVIFAIVIINSTGAAEETDNFDFTHQGNTLLYTVIDDNAKTVEVSMTSYPVKGALIIPSKVARNNVEYTVTRIADSAFVECHNLTSADIPNTVASIGEYAFYDCDYLTSVSIGNSVTSIGAYAFYHCSRITSLIIPNTVTDIENKSFCNCTGLTSMTIGDSVKTIGESAFSGCSGLTSVKIPKSVTSIMDEAFYECTSIKEFVVEAGSTTYTSVEGVLYTKDMQTLMLYPREKKQITFEIPGTVKTIGKTAFSNCNLEKVTIHNSVTRIEDSAFIYCEFLDPVEIPNSVVYIGDFAFAFCSYFQDLEIPNSVKTIGSHAFYNCSSLSYVEIPKSVESIGENAFLSTADAQRVVVTPSATLKIHKGAFPNASKVEFKGNYSVGSNQTLAFPNAECIDFFGNYTIGAGAFKEDGFNNLKTVRLHDESVIEESAFEGKKIEMLSLEKCKSIGKNALQNDRYFKKIWCYSEEPPVIEDKNAFDGVPAATTIYVPRSSVSKYKMTYGWSRFENYVGMGTCRVNFTPEEIHLDMHKLSRLSYDVISSGNYSLSSIKWCSSDENVATVTGTGVITGENSGMAMIYITADNNYGLSDVYKGILATVGDVDFACTLIPEKDEIAIGDSTQIKVNYGGQGYKVISESWSTSDSRIASVNQVGVVTALTKGKSIITLNIEFDNGILWKKDCVVIVREDSGHVDDIEEENSETNAVYFDLNGVRVDAQSLIPGIYIKRLGDKVTKVIVK